MAPRAPCRSSHRDAGYVILCHGRANKRGLKSVHICDFAFCQLANFRTHHPLHASLSSLVPPSLPRAPDVAPSQADGTGGVYVFELPANPLTDPWVRHDLAVGFKPIHYHLPGTGGPGTARAFHADTRDTVLTPSPTSSPSSPLPKIR